MGLETILFCIWLIPAEPYQNHLSDTIKQLSATYSSPKFHPHVTLFCGKTNDIEKAQKDLGHVVQSQQKMSLNLKSIDSSPAYYKSVYFQFYENKPANSLNKLLKETLDKDSNYTFNPHLSLMYKDMPIGEKKKIALELQDSLAKSTDLYQSILFDKIVLITDTEKEGAKAVASWEVLQSYDLK